MIYPVVLTEQETLDRVCAGQSLARYGDGEFRLCAGHSIPCQMASLKLRERLRMILHDSGDCLVGIPNLTDEGPKAEYWSRYLSAAALLTPRTYGSAFISRPDSAPWINTPAYWTQMESLWDGQDVTLVRGNRRGLSPADLSTARSVREIRCAPENAWIDYDRLLAEIGTPDRVLLCVGPTATVLAVDLCARGVHAVDLGHTALFLRKYRRGEPMTVTEADKVLV